MDIREMVKGDKRVTFIHYKDSELWYSTECGFEFPVPLEDVGDSTLNATESAMLFVKYIRAHLKVVEQAQD